MRRALLLLAALAWSGGAQAAGKAKPAGIVLLVVDALRADGVSEKAAPRLAALGREGAVFEDVIAQSNWTLPALSSLMTGLYPGAHGAQLPPKGARWAEELQAGRLKAAPGGRLEPSRPTLASRLRAAGYATGAVVSGGFCRSEFGFAQGFDDYRDDGRPLADTLPLALSWLEAHKDRPFFLYIHAGDVHDSYKAATERSTASLEGLYAAGISTVDAQVGVLLDRLKTWGLADRTLVAVTADHGESFFEHGALGHAGTTLYDEVLRVPLLMRGPGIEPGARPRAQARQIDIAPTLLEAAGGRAAGMQGRSLLPWLRGGKAQDRTAFAETLLQAAVRDGGWKLLRLTDGSRRLFDLKADPQERRDLYGASEAGAQRRRLEALLAAHQKENRAVYARLGPVAKDGPELPAEVREKLEASGYLRERP